MAYTKLHQALVTSTIWREPSPTRIVWVTMMALADKNGEVMASIPGLADLARVTVEECEAALAAFLSPDKYSRTKTMEGRRIQEIRGGWVLVNHPDYRKLASKEDETEKASIRMARMRRNKASQTVTERNTPEQNVTVTENRDIAEADAQAELGGQSASNTAVAAPPRLRTSEEYIGKLKASGAYDGIDIDREFDKMVLWNEARGKKPTERKLVAWLNRIEVPMTRVDTTPTKPREIR